MPKNASSPAGGLLGGVSTPVEMRFEKSENGFSVYTADYVFDAAGVYYYRFEMRNRDGVWYYGRGENGESVCGENLPEWQLTVYKSSYKTPDFVKGNIIYHIFVDRFNRADGVKTKRKYLRGLLCPYVLCRGFDGSVR